MSARSFKRWRCCPSTHSPAGRDDRFPGCRSLQVEQHVIYFHQPRPNEVEVLRILHQRQDASAEVTDPRG